MTPISLVDYAANLGPSSKSNGRREIQQTHRPSLSYDLLTNPKQETNMSEPTQDQDKTQIVPKREVRVVVDDSTQGYLFDTARFEHAMRIAGAMASANLIPKHLREDKNGEFHPDTIRANCFIIVNQAIRWGFDPFSLLKECYVVGGVLGWQGKLVCAVINARAGLKQNLDFTFTGKKGTPEYEVTVHGTFKGEDKERIVTLTVAEAKTANDIWVADPEQKLCYSGAIKWSRRHAPEIVLGVLTEDDVDKIAADKAKPITAKVVEKPVFAVEDKKVPMQPHEHLVKSDAEIEDEKIMQRYLASKEEAK